eukprot:CAMPEP_0197909776 /NCGR_PEP_ID=MMETSP1439-20131203/69561_1 /TAXON_ID=66791 /ORGANISM="Gonyaulax spinifera, Strain CCMP409" /LENGTH=41 /DNA_ID= /DNA_START= /DNA_END= /DNA_ORIENTATION=
MGASGRAGSWACTSGGGLEMWTPRWAQQALAAVAAAALPTV